MTHLISRAAGLSLVALTTALTTSTIYAHEDGTHPSTAMDHAPIGVMADHRHDKGEWMLSYRYMYMDMAGNRDGTDGLNNSDIVTGYPNIFGMPATLRVIPETMPMQMHMIGGMYGLTDSITLLAMVNYLQKDMDHTTYQGMMGDTELGGFETRTTGFGDTVVGAIIGLDDGIGPDALNVRIALSLPTGSIKETGKVLTPMNTAPTLTLPYAMQLGSGSVDFMPAVTYTNRNAALGWGVQAAARLALDENDQGYTLGDSGELIAWLSYETSPSWSFSGRLHAKSQNPISGQDQNIAAPVQTANPDNYGGTTVSVLAGINWMAQNDPLKGHRLALEYGVPVHQDLKGPQMETDQTLTLGWQKAF